MWDRAQGGKRVALLSSPGMKIELQLLSALVGGLVLPAAIAAQENLYERDLVDQYGSRFLAVIIAVGAALVIFSLIRFRGRDTGPIAWSFLIAGTTLFPLILSGAGTFLVVERVKTVRLCGSCHLTMKPYVDDMENPSSKSLAAIHYANRYIATNQCYECHTSYGLLGTFQAKEQGMIDVFRYYTRTFTLPLKLSSPYRDSDCLKCHAAATKWIATHADFEKRIFAGQLTCMQCHAETTPPHLLTTQEAQR